LLTWIGELISEFASATVCRSSFSPDHIAFSDRYFSVIFTFDMSQLPAYIAFATAAAVIIAGVVFISEAERPIPMTYARRVRGQSVMGGVSTYMPLRVNTAGVIRLSLRFRFCSSADDCGVPCPIEHHLACRRCTVCRSGLANQLVYVFSTSVLCHLHVLLHGITFEPHQVAKNLQKSGAFIPGVRPVQ